jgi:predicted naringenin-chalcone synthase
MTEPEQTYSVTQELTAARQALLELALAAGAEALAEAIEYVKAHPETMAPGTLELLEHFAAIEGSTRS